MQKVFISYVHDDVTFARDLAHALRSAGFEPLLDEERLVSGDILEDGLRAMIATADCGVFLVTPDFVDSDYCMEELRIFAEDFPAKRRIPILRRPRKSFSRLPARLGARRTTTEWLESTNRDEGIYQLLCAIRNEKPGPRKEWAAKGRRATANLPAEQVAPSPLRPKTSPRVAALDLRSLKCDRAREWSIVEDVYSQPSHDVVLIGGTPADAHDHFVIRIEHYLRGDSPFRRVNVDWRMRPKTEGECLELIARALPCDPYDLVAELRRLMASENVILFHTAVDRQHEDETLRSYYAEWLPALIAAVAPVQSLKCIQPVEWDSPPPLRAAARRWMKRIFGGPQRWLGTASERKGLAFMNDVCARRGETAITIALDEGTVEDKDIRDFCQSERVSRPECEQLLKEIRASRLTEAIDIFDHIDDFMRRRQQPA
jgi:hypothetical protein